MNKSKKVKFKSEDEERRFWAKQDVTDYTDLKLAKRVHFPNLRPSLRTISIRLPQHLIEDLKALANERDIPYQALLKQFLADRVHEEWNRRAA